MFEANASAAGELGVASRGRSAGPRPASCRIGAAAGSGDADAAHGRQARPDHGRGQRPLDRLGHRQGRRRGGELAFTYQGEVFGKRVRPLAESLGSIAAEATSLDEASLDGSSPPCRALGPDRFRGPCHRLFRPGTSSRAAMSTRRAAISCAAGHLLLFLHRCLPPRGAADERGRQPPDLDLSRRRARRAALQRDGRGQGRARGERALSRRRSRRRQHPRQRDLRRPDQDLGRRPASATSAIS